MSAFHLAHSRLLTLRPEMTDDERGASIVEYALLVALIALVCIAAVSSLGSTTSGSVSEAVSRLA